MAAPSNTIWGSIAGGYGRIGIAVTRTDSLPSSSFTVDIWFWSKYSVSDTNNTLFYDNLSATGSATTSAGSISISTTVESGEGWSTSNQVRLKRYTYTYARIKTTATRYVYAKLQGVDRVGATMYASTSLTIPAKASYTVSYNANGGTGAPSEQTKWYAETLKLQPATPTKPGYTFQGWSTANDSSVEYAAGANYTTNAGVTLYAVWKANTYTITYNANGGTGAPSDQTKTYGVALPLSTTKPTRSGYNFLGWALSSSATKATYAAGASYTGNANTTLYAVWEVGYIKPRITKYTAVRGTYTGGIFTEDAAGMTMRIIFTYECDLNNDTVYTIYITDASGTQVFTSQRYLSALSGTETSYFAISLSSDASYTVKLVVDDTGGSSTMYTTLNGTLYPIDALAGGKGVAFGKPAEIENLCDIHFQTRLEGGLLYPLLPAETDLNTVRTPNNYTGENVAHYSYENCPVTNGTFVLTVESCGDAGQVKQTFTTCSKYKPEVYSRFYYQEGWGDWFVASTDEVVLYENSSGTTGTITFQLGSNASDNPSAANYRYLEIYYTDNNGKSGGYTKVWNPNGKTVCLSIVEASSTIYSRQTMYTISGSTMTPDVTNASYFRIASSGGVSTSIGTNYIKIVRIIGRA